MPSIQTFFAGLDGLHRGRDASSALDKRMLTGRVFGVEIPAYVIFHAVLGYVLLGVGLAAIFLRIPLKAIKRNRWLHRYMGYLWIFGTIWMPVTAIWCVTRVDWDVVAFFIFSMYAAIQAGWIAVQIYRAKKGKQALLSTNDLSGARTPWKVRLFVIAHAIFMIYSVIMLLGAGISFPFRAFDEYTVNKKGN